MTSPIATTRMPEACVSSSRQSSRAEPAAPTSAPKSTNTAPKPSTNGATPRSVRATPRCVPQVVHRGSADSREVGGDEREHAGRRERERARSEGRCEGGRAHSSRASSSSSCCSRRSRSALASAGAGAATARQRRASSTARRAAGQEQGGRRQPRQRAEARARRIGEHLGAVLRRQRPLGRAAALAARLQAHELTADLVGLRRVRLIEAGLAGRAHQLRRELRNRPAVLGGGARTERPERPRDQRRRREHDDEGERGHVQPLLHAASARPTARASAAGAGQADRRCHEPPARVDREQRRERRHPEVALRLASAAAARVGRIGDRPVDRAALREGDHARPPAERRGGAAAASCRLRSPERRTRSGAESRAATPATSQRPSRRGRAAPPGRCVLQRCAHRAPAAACRRAPRCARRRAPSRRSRRSRAAH